MKLLKTLKALVSAAMVIGMASCHPVMAKPKEPKTTQVAMATCLVADHYIETIYHMAKQGRDNYEIMLYLDSVSDPDDREYLGIVMAKVNVSLVQMAVRKAYSQKQVVERHKQICIEQIGNEITYY